jgi:hypothetical protein
MLYESKNLVMLNLFQHPITNGNRLQFITAGETCGVPKQVRHDGHL